jgi:prevent-host-death family protein
VWFGFGQGLDERAHNVSTTTIMEKSISAAAANRKFSQLLRDVREGQSYVVTNRGKPVSRIVPLHENRGVRATSRSRLLNRLRSQRVTEIGPWERGNLYDKHESILH